MIIDGGFENPPVSGALQTFGTGSVLGGAGGWTVVSGSVDVINSYWPAVEGKQSLDLAGSTNNGGAIAQTFATTVGQTYLLTFEYANNTDVPFATANVLVFSNPTAPLLNDNISHSGSSNASLAAMNYTAFSATFTADAASTTLQFTSTSPFLNNGIALDDVAVTQVTPAPPTVALLGAGAATLLVAGWCRRGRRRAAPPAA
jgi:choice-of-anchor C domain-containing protein